MADYGEATAGLVDGYRVAGDAAIPARGEGRWRAEDVVGMAEVDTGGGVEGAGH